MKHLFIGMDLSKGRDKSVTNIMTTEQLKSEVERGNFDAIPQYMLSLLPPQNQRVVELKFAIRESLYYLRLGETGRATEILNQALSA